MTRAREHFLGFLTFVGSVLIISIVLNAFGIGATKEGTGLERHPAFLSLFGAVIQAVVAGVAIYMTGRFGREQLSHQWAAEAERTNADLKELRRRSKELGELACLRISDAASKLRGEQAVTYARSGVLSEVIAMHYRALERLPFERLGTDELAAFEGIVVNAAIAKHQIEMLHEQATQIWSKVTHLNFDSANAQTKQRSSLCADALDKLAMTMAEGTAQLHST